MAVRLATQLFNTRRPYSYLVFVVILLAFAQLWQITTSNDRAQVLSAPSTEVPPLSDDEFTTPRCREALKLLNGLKQKIEPKIKDQVVSNDHSVKAEDGKWYWDNRYPMPGCWEYEERYGPYRTLSPEILAAIDDVNKCNADAAVARKKTGRTRNAIVLRTAEQEEFKEDFQLHTKALMVELATIGWEVYNVIHIEKKDAKQKELIKEHIPAWMQSFTIPIRFTQAAAMWPKKIQSFYFDNQASIAWFHKAHGPFDRVYVLEGDVRYIGRWDKFILSVDFDYQYYQHNHPNNRNLPAYPDFTTFELVAQAKPDWWGSATIEPNYPYNKGRHSLGVIWGYSGKLLNTIDQALKERGSAYFEAFVPTVANVYNLTTFQVAHTLYGPKRDFAIASEKYIKVGDWDVSMYPEKGPQIFGGTYKYEGPESEDWYRNWVEKKVQCRPPGLLHPVKLKPKVVNKST